jgi:hypothetical protein
MKRVSRLLMVLVLVVVAAPLSAMAQGPDSAPSASVTYTSGFQLQNLTGSLATVAIAFYNQDGSIASTVNDTIAGNTNKTYYPLSAVASGFNGSVVVSSDQQLAAITNVLGNNGQRGASYGGFSTGATTVNLPLVMKAYYGIDTWFNVQNTGSSATTVNIAYKPGSCTESVSVAPGAAKTFKQADNSCLAAGFVGAASITSSEPVVAVVMQVDAQSLLAYTGFTTASTNPVMPLVSSNYYKSGTGITIQNTGASPTNVTLSYKPSAGFPGAACTETKSIPAGQSANYSFPQLPAGCGTSGSGVSDTVNGGFVGSAAVTTNSANMPLVAMVNSVTRGTANAAAYEAFNSATATSKVAFPLIMDRNYNIFTGIAVANVGASATNVTCTFTGTSYTASATSLQPGAALTDVQLNKIASGYVGAATCTASGGDAKIAGIVTELTNGAASTTDALLAYDGFNY